MGTIELWDLPWVGRKGRPLPPRSGRLTGAGQGTSGPSSGGAQTDSGMDPWLSVLHVCGHRQGDEQDRYEEAVENGSAAVSRRDRRGDEHTGEEEKGELFQGQGNDLDAFPPAAHLDLRLPQRYATYR